MEKEKDTVWESYIDQIKNRKPKLQPPTPIDREIKIPAGEVLFSSTDTKGVIKYCNEAFVDVSGYEEYELAGAAHNIIRHPDMPRVIFKFMWERIQNNQNIIAVVKNMGKTGRYYWVITDFVTEVDLKGNITGYKAFRKPAPRKAIEAIIPIYKKLIEIEKSKDMQVAEDFLFGYLDGKGTNYDDFIASLIIDNIQTNSTKEVAQPTSKAERKSFFKRLFGN